MKYKHNKKNTAFELYRAVAVSMVVLGHFFSFSKDVPIMVKKLIASFAYYGVPIFFIISGYLLSASFISLLKNTEYRFCSALNIFFAKRILRIYPAYLISLIILSIYSNSSILDFVVHLLNIHNLFDEFSRSINGVYWSLAVEFQWYLVAPIVILFFVKTNTIAQLLLFSTSVTISILLRFNVLNDFIRQSISFDNLVRLGNDQLYVYFFNFLIGVFLYRCRNIKIKIHLLITIFLSILILCADYIKGNVISDIVNYREKTVQCKLLLDYISISILGAVMFAFMNIELEKKYYRIISFISTVSYSLYIYHFPILHYLGNYNFAWYLFFPVYILTSFLFATISYYMVEAPFLKYSKLLEKNTIITTRSSGFGFAERRGAKPNR